MNVTTFAGVMHIDPVDCWIRNHMMGSGRMFEEDLIRNKLAPYVEKAKYIVDAGANIGCHTVSYAKINPNSRIWSFEPQSQTFEFLKKNVTVNNLDERVKIFQSALSHTTGKAQLKSETTQAFPGQGVNRGGLGLGTGGEDITQMTLDSLNLPGLDFMKIDVEGAEGLVLMGAVNTIRKYKPVITFEHNFQRVDPAAVGLEVVPTPFEVLVDLGYSVFVHIGENNYITKIEV